MKQQASMCLFIKTEFHESNSAVLKNLQMLQFYQKELKKTSVKMQAYSSRAQSYWWLPLLYLN